MAEVLIGCKLPHGLILELIEPGRNPDTFDEDRKLLKRGEIGLYPRRVDPKSRVVLKGSNSLRAPGQKVNDEGYRHAVTRVDKSFWEQWYKANQGLDFVRNGFVFVAESDNAAKGMAKERADEKTGTEPLNQQSDPRTQGVTADPEHLKALMQAEPA